MVSSSAFHIKKAANSIFLGRALTLVLLSVPDSGSLLRKIKRPRLRTAFNTLLVGVQVDEADDEGKGDSA
jgi:hypothetical protein